MVRASKAGPDQQVCDVDAACRNRFQYLNCGGQRGSRGGTDGGVLVAQQVLCLGRPRQQLGIEHQPVGVQLVPEVCLVDGLSHRLQELFGRGGREERSAGAGVHRAGGAVAGAEPARADLGTATDQDNGARAHVLLLADHLRHAAAPVEVEGGRRVLEEVTVGRGGCWRHRGRQVQQPTRLDGEAAHHLQRPGGVLLPHGHPPREPGLDTALAQHVGDRQLVRCTPERLGGGSRRGWEGLGRLVPDLLRGHGDDLILRIPQCGELAPENAAGVQTQRVVDPFRTGRGGVSVENHRRSAVVLGPRVAHRQAELVGLAGGVPVQREAANSRRGTPLVLLLQPGVGDHEPAAVQDEMGDQSVAELLYLRTELRRLGGQLSQRGLQSVADLHLPSLQRPDELALVVTGHAERMSGREHSHDQPQHAR